MLAQLTCRSFRNLESTPWQPGPGCHLVLGPNGAGKTSLLEAVYLLATTRSFRTARLPDCSRHGSQEFHLQAEIEADQRVRLEVGLGPTGRYRGVNGRDTSLIDHLRVLPVVAWTGEDKQLLSGPPERRRRFLDQGIVGSRPSALETLARFRRVMAQKRRLLAASGSGLTSWNEVLAAAAAELMTLRREYVEEVATNLEQILESIELDMPEVSLEYRPSIEVEGDRTEDILEVLMKAGEEERREGRPLVGPQRDEVLIRWGERSVRRVGSAGEMKLLGLLLTVARGRVLSALGRSPVYLLDDADSELDEGRLAAVWQVFSRAEQVFVSSSRPAVWAAASNVLRWDLRAGRLRPLEGSLNPI